MKSIISKITVIAIIIAISINSNSYNINIVRLKILMLEGLRNDWFVQYNTEYNTIYINTIYNNI